MGGIGVSGDPVRTLPPTSQGQKCPIPDGMNSRSRFQVGGLVPSLSSSGLEPVNVVRRRRQKEER